MSKTWRLLFFGYLFVFFRLEIGIDVLAAPIGYYMIYSAARKLSVHYGIAKRLEFMAFVGVFLAVPGVFVHLTEAAGGWKLYAEMLFVWKVIMAYYLFGTWKAMLQEVGYAQLRGRVRVVYVLYMGIHFLMMLIAAFSLNFGSSSWMSLFLFVSVLVVVMDIALLLLIASLRKVSLRDKEEKSSLAQ